MAALALSSDVSKYYIANILISYNDVKLMEETNLTNYHVIINMTPVETQIEISTTASTDPSLSWVMAFTFPAVTQNYASEPINEYVILGNDAIIKCSVPSFMSDFISIVGWTDESGNEFRVYGEDQKLGKSPGNCVISWNGLELELRYQEEGFV